MCVFVLYFVFFLSGCIFIPFFSPFLFFLSLFPSAWLTFLFLSCCHPSCLSPGFPLSAVAHVPSDIAPPLARACFHPPTGSVTTRRTNRSTTENDVQVVLCNPSGLTTLSPPIFLCAGLRWIVAPLLVRTFIHASMCAISPQDGTE